MQQSVLWLKGKRDLFFLAVAIVWELVKDYFDDEIKPKAG